MSRPQPATLIARPEPDEYHAYYETYVGKVAAEPVLDVLEAQREEVRALLAGIDEATAARRYAARKWSVREVIGHLIDSERVFGFRALWFARDRKEALPDMDADAFVAAADFDRRALADLAAEHAAVRRSSLALFRSLSQEQLLRRGTASGRDFSTRAVAFIIAGHERHHLEILAERYGVHPYRDR